jgi:hypothetical protein
MSAPNNTLPSWNPSSYHFSLLTAAYSLLSSDKVSVSACVHHLYLNLPPTVLSLPYWHCSYTLSLNIPLDLSFLDIGYLKSIPPSHTSTAYSSRTNASLHCRHIRYSRAWTLWVDLLGLKVIPNKPAIGSMPSQIGSARRRASLPDKLCQR